MNGRGGINNEQAYLWSRFDIRSCASVPVSHKSHSLAFLGEYYCFKQIWDCHLGIVVKTNDLTKKKL